jgi:hypothetical protein
MKDRDNLSFWYVLLSCWIFSLCLLGSALFAFFGLEAWRLWRGTNFFVLLLVAGALWWSWWNYQQLKGIYHFREASYKYFIIIFSILGLFFFAALFQSRDKSVAFTMTAWAGMAIIIMSRIFNGLERETFTYNPEEERTTS